MTICIAGICDYGHSIVLAADKEYGIGLTSADFPDGKFLPLYKDWSAGLAGSVSNATDVILATRGIAPASLGIVDVRASLEAAYRKVRLSRAEGRFLANRGWTLEDYNMFGSSRMSQGTYAMIDNQLSSFDFDADLIVAGFGENDNGPSILTVRNPGIVVDHTKLGFWCVGSGSTLAQTSLFSRKYSWVMSVEEAAYCVFEAKLNAESATGVGRTTDLIICRRGHAPLAISPGAIDVMRNIYDELRPKEFEPRHRDFLQRGSTEFAMLKSAP